MRRGAKHSVERVTSSTRTAGAVDTRVDQRTVVVGASTSTGASAAGGVAVEARCWCASCSTTNASSAVGSDAVDLRAEWTLGAEAREAGGALGR